MDKRSVSQSAQPTATTKTSARGATSTEKQKVFRSYIAHHKKVARDSLKQLWKSPVATFLNWLVIGIAITFPAAGLLLLADLESVASNLDDGNQITIFLKLTVSDDEAKKLGLKLAQKDGVSAILFVSRDEALRQLEGVSGFKDALILLDRNPLPASYIITPSAGLNTPEKIAELVKQLSAIPEVDTVQFDLEWVQRLFAMLDVVARIVIAVGGMFFLAVLLVVSNTIRLAIENRRDEISIVKLVGGTDSFVRRPFLYMGLWFGAGGVFVAMFFIELGFSWLNTPVRLLATSYGSDFYLTGLTLESFVLLLGVGCSLGWLGARYAVGRHLNESFSATY